MANRHMLFWIALVACTDDVGICVVYFFGMKPLHLRYLLALVYCVHLTKSQRCNYGVDAGVDLKVASPVCG